MSRYEDQGQLQLVDPDDMEEEEDSFESIDKCKIESLLFLINLHSLLFVEF